MESALVPYASNTLSTLLGEQASGALTPAVTQGLNALVKNSVPKIQKTPAQLIDDLRAAHSGVVDFKNKNGLDYDTLNTRVFDYAPHVLKVKDSLKAIMGEEGVDNLANNLSGMLKMGIPEDQYLNARATATNWLGSKSSDSAVDLSRKLVEPGTKIYRANNSPDGISWTLNRQVALNAVQDNLPYVRNNRAIGAPDIREYILRPQDRYIAPQLTEYLNENPLVQDEVLFNLPAANNQDSIPTNVRKYIK